MRNSHQCQKKCKLLWAKERNQSSLARTTPTLGRLPEQSPCVLYRNPADRAVGEHGERIHAHQKPDQHLPRVVHVPSRWGPQTQETGSVTKSPITDAVRETPGSRTQETRSVPRRPEASQETRSVPVAPITDAVRGMLDSRQQRHVPFEPGVSRFAPPPTSKFVTQLEKCLSTER